MTLILSGLNMTNLLFVIAVTLFLVVFIATSIMSKRADKKLNEDIKEWIKLLK